MAFGREMKRRAKAVAAPLVFLSIVAYFGWNVVQGDHGSARRARAAPGVAGAGAGRHQAKAQTDRDAWELRVSGLRSRHIDADSLDERTRAMLNLADPTDVIVQYTPSDKLF